MSHRFLLTKAPRNVQVNLEDERLVITIDLTQRFAGQNRHARTVAATDGLLPVAGLLLNLSLIAPLDGPVPARRGQWQPLMPRIRTLKPEHRQHRKVGALDHVSYRLWVGMILEADDEGRLVCELPRSPPRDDLSRIAPRSRSRELSRSSGF